MRTPQERGQFGQRLVDERTARGWTQKEMLAYLESVGVHLAPSVYAAYESGAHRPQPARREQMLALLTETQESPAPDATPGAGLSELLGLQQQLVIAFEVQAQAVMALVDEIRESRAVEVENLYARVRVLEAAVLAFHPELEDSTSSTQSAPRATEGLGRDGAAEA